MNKNIKRIIFLAGWLLSPFTWWNDALVNIPLSYLLASIFSSCSADIFPSVFVFFYWMSNLLGVFLVYISSVDSFRRAKKYKIFMAVLLYSLAIYILTKQNIIPPLPIRG